MIDYSRVKLLSDKEYVQYFNAHYKELYAFIDRFSPETLCRIYHELEQQQWDETTLGEFRGGRFAQCLCFAIDSKIGRYELEKYECLVLKKNCNSEAEYDRRCIKDLMDSWGKKFNPIYNKNFW